MVSASDVGRVSQLHKGGGGGGGANGGTALWLLVPRDGGRGGEEWNIWRELNEREVRMHNCKGSVECLMAHSTH